jgi:hypothetical protein
MYSNIDVIGASIVGRLKYVPDTIFIKVRELYLYLSSKYPITLSNIEICCVLDYVTVTELMRLCVAILVHEIIAGFTFISKTD